MFLYIYYIRLLPCFGHISWPSSGSYKFGAGPSNPTLPTVQVLKSLAAIFSVLKNSFFVELRASLCNVKLCSLTKSGATVGGMCTNMLQSHGTHAGCQCFLITCGVIMSLSVQRAPVCC